ncbi:THAP domain-containing protein 2-like [Macrobrachium nipponense]|uniref:THAP domain-containing protein 2-like n=1 Tax=Macrobrachium nipponense TaxID=159736 RepID=UPI0030C82FD8
MKREFWTPSKRSVLCSDHFDSCCFDKTGCTTRIRSDAVPTVFTSAVSEPKESKMEAKKKKKKELLDPGENEAPTSFEARYSKRRRTQKLCDPDFVYEETFTKRPRMSPQHQAAVRQKVSLQKLPRTKLMTCNTQKHHLKENSSSVPSNISVHETSRNLEKDDLEQVNQISASLHKITSKDKVTHLPNNFIHFEFATPRRQVIVELNSKVENSGLRCSSLLELLNSLREETYSLLMVKI